MTIREDEMVARFRACVNAAPSNGNVVLTWDTAGRVLKIATALSSEREILRELLDDLQQAEAEYRLMHDRHGDGSQAAGRAWDLMRRAGGKARAALDTGVTK